MKIASLNHNFSFLKSIPRPPPRSLYDAPAVLRVKIGIYIIFCSFDHAFSN
jgi:hypothetical protein